MPLLGVIYLINSFTKIVRIRKMCQIFRWRYL